MRKKSPSGQQVTAKLEDDSSRPEVIVDFVFERGVFHLAVENIGTAPAYRSLRARGIVEAIVAAVCIGLEDP